MKNSINRVYDQAVEMREAMTVKAFKAGQASDIDQIGTVFDKFENKQQTAAFNELVRLGIVVRSDVEYEA